MQRFIRARPIEFWVLAAVFVVMVILASTGQFSKDSTSAAGPSLTLVGGSTCNETTQSTFSYQLTGFTPGANQAMVIVRYPDGSFYYFQKSYGIVTIPSGGSFRSIGWACWYGPNNTMDPHGTYTIRAVDLATGATTKQLTFVVTG